MSLGLLATTSKLMWRQQENLLIQLYSHDSPPRIIAIVAHNEATQEVRNVARGRKGTISTPCIWLTGTFSPRTKIGLPTHLRQPRPDSAQSTGH